MRPANGADILEPRVATDNYEVLRANALGNRNQAPGFSLFLRDGMRGWLRGLTEQGYVRQMAQPEPSVSGEPDVALPATGLASILTDAILNAFGNGQTDTAEVTHEHTNAITP